MKWKSSWDGKEYDIKPAHGTVKQWQSGKCWSVFCGNGILYVNIGKTGLWNFGYCHGDYDSWKYRSIYDDCHPRGAWYLAVKGKLLVDKWPKK